MDSSLRRLNTDYIDVLHLHTVTPGQYANALDRLLPTLHRLKEIGKIRCIGITEAFGRDRNHLMLTRAVGAGAFDCIMIGFNCFIMRVHYLPPKLSIGGSVSSACMQCAVLAATKVCRVT